MAVPYELTGRRRQKARTRDALLAATRALLRDGAADPTVEEAAEAAGVSRTTAYRYFPDQRALLLATHPETARRSLLPDDAPADPVTRLDLTMTEFARITLEWEPQLRTALRLSLTGPATADGPARRQGRAVEWIAEALAPLRDSHPHLDVHQLAVTIRAATGIEAVVWLTDVGGVPREEIAERVRWTARALLGAASGFRGAEPNGNPGAPDRHS